jgi:taurine dioxygenase
MTIAAVNLKEDVRFERATGAVGAWVHGIELGKQSAETVDTLVRGLHEHGVLFFDFGRIPSEVEFKEFAQTFGEVETSYGQKMKDQSKVGSYIDMDQVPMKSHYQNRWHSDGGPLELPPQAALLTPLELPPAGGDTMWASMYAAWDALSPRYQALLDGLEVLNSNVRLPFLEPKQFVHPAVLKDPVTGKKMLYVNSGYSERLLGLSEKESDSLLQFIFDHVNTAEFHVRLKWRLGVVAIWEERVTQHKGVDDFKGPRKLKRLTIAGSRPAA